VYRVRLEHQLQDLCEEKRVVNSLSHLFKFLAAAHLFQDLANNQLDEEEGKGQHERAQIVQHIQGLKTQSRKVSIHGVAWLQVEDSVD